MINSQAHPNASHDRLRWTNGIIIAAVVGLLLMFLRAGVSQTVAAAILIIAGCAIALLLPDAGIIATLIYLLFLGDIRRLVSLEAGRTSQDPLLLVGPIVVGVLFLRLVFERKIRPDTPLAKMILVLMIFMGLEIFNPLQGGLTVGVAGAMFYMVPLLWFWVGRSLPSEWAAGELVRVIFPILAALAALLGLYQTYVGYLSFELQWVREQIANGFAAMVISGSVVRAFSFFTSPGEYALFLGVGVVCCAAPLIVGRLRLVTLLIPLLLWAMFLASVRSAILLAAVAIFAMVSLTGRDSQQMVSRAFLAFVLGGGIMYFGLHRLQEMESASLRIDTLIDHTTGGFLNPGESSAEGHLQIAIWGIEKGLKNPIGEGLGSTTMAAAKFSTRGGAGYENDVADMFASLGVFGGLLYVAIILFTMYTVFVVWRDGRTFTSLVVFGILVSQLGYWLAGGHYALAAISWFLIGRVDRANIKLAAQAPQPVHIGSGHARPAYQP
jgi:hypothetical protein